MHLITFHGITSPFFTFLPIHWWKFTSQSIFPIPRSEIPHLALFNSLNRCNPIYFRFICRTNKNNHDSSASERVPQLYSRSGFQFYNSHWPQLTEWWPSLGPASSRYRFHRCSHRNSYIFQPHIDCFNHIWHILWFVAFSRTFNMWITMTCRAALL
jgi:hypothetical protein